MWHVRGKALYASVAVLILIIAAIWGFSTTRAKGRGGKIEIIAEKGVYLVGEKVNLSVKGAPGGANITWDFGDGRIGYGMEVNHTYRRSAFYSIVATAVWKENGGYWKSVENITVEVRNRDESRYFEGGPFRNLRPLWILGWGGYLSVYPGTTQPTVYVNATLRGAVGQVGLEIDFISGDDYRTLASEKQPATYEEITYHLTFSDELQPLTQEGTVMAYVMVYEGRISEWNVSIECHY